MTSFAEIDENNVVIRVVEADIDFINSGKLGNPSNFIETSTIVRRRFAGKGFKYNMIADSFLGKTGFPSWVLNPVTLDYEAPTPKPNDEYEYRWNESLTRWEKLDFQGQFVLKSERV